MTRVLVTGAKGQLGREIRKLRMLFPQNYEFTDVEELDLLRPEDIREFLSEKQVGWIINCAAYTDVDGAENDRENAMRLNRDLVVNLMHAIEAHPGIRLIHISTDYIFSGDRPRPYVEEDEASPLSIYGESKLEGEKILHGHPSALVIRTSWLYSIFGRNFVKGMMNRMDRREELRVVYDQVGSPTYAEDLARAIMQIIAWVEDGTREFHPGIFNYSNEGVCSWYDFAWEICRMIGCSLEPAPIESKSLDQAARRPPYAVLNKDKIRKVYGVEVPYWKESLEKCINELK